MNKFDTSKSDTQATRVDPVKVSDFPFRRISNTNNN